MSQKKNAKLINRGFCPLTKIPTQIYTQVLVELALHGGPREQLQLLDIIKRNPVPDGIVQEQGKAVLDQYSRIIQN